MIANLVAVILTFLMLVVAFVVMANVADLDPPGMNTELGTVASDVSDELRITVTPLPGAGPFKRTVPVLIAPPTKLVGEAVNSFRAGL